MQRSVPTIARPCQDGALHDQIQAASSMRLRHHFCKIVRAKRTHLYCMQEPLCNRSVCWTLCSTINRTRQSGAVMRRSASEAPDSSNLQVSGCIVCMVLLLEQL
jgi:hypothetical protein